MSRALSLPPDAVRAFTVKPRRTKYRHRDIITVVNRVGVTEHGELVSDLPRFAVTAPDSMLWVTFDPADLLNVMVAALGDHPAFNYQIVESREPEHTMTMTVPRLTRFGLTGKGKEHTGKGKGRNKPMHMVWDPASMMRNPADVVDGNTHPELLKFALDVREWCRTQDLPLPTSLAGIASAMLKDSRIYPDPRGRVPRATNENVRKYLPGVYSELLAEPNTTHTAVAIDQRRAYHKAAQTIALPDSSSLFARGYFPNPDTEKLWCERGDIVYNRTIRQPGLVAARVTSRVTTKGEVRIPCLNYSGTKVIFLWTNEIETAEDMGADIHGLTAAWTSNHADTGMPRYGAWAESEIDAASAYRARWLKPTLHGVYGLLAARARDVSIGHRVGNGPTGAFVLGIGHTFPVHVHTRKNVTPPTTNVPALGMLQSEIRTRSILMARNLTDQGVDVLHIHADGIHVSGPLPLMDDTWSMEPRTNLRYLDPVSWLSDERDCLPGRDERARVELARHMGRVLTGRR